MSSSLIICLAYQNQREQSDEVYSQFSDLPGFAKVNTAWLCERKPGCTQHTYILERCALVPSSVHAFSHTEMVWLGNVCRMNYIYVGVITRVDKENR